MIIKTIVVSSNCPYQNFPGVGEPTDLDPQKIQYRFGKYSRYKTCLAVPVTLPDILSIYFGIEK